MQLSRTAKIAIAAAMGGAMIAGGVMMLRRQRVPPQPCPVPRLSFAGDRVGPACEPVPMGLLYVVSADSLTRVNTCLDNLSNVPCMRMLSDGTGIWIHRCFGPPTPCDACSPAVPFHHLPEASCETARAKYGGIK